MFKDYYSAKKYYDGMVRCLSGYKFCDNQIIETRKEIENEDFIETYQRISNGKIITLEAIKEVYMGTIRGFERGKCKIEREFQEKYGVQTPEELETKIREFRPELKRLKTLELQKLLQKGMGRSELRRVKKTLR